MWRQEELLFWFHRARRRRIRSVRFTAHGLRGLRQRGRHGRAVADQDVGTG